MTELICIVCPKGCRIRAEKQADGSVAASGAGCEKGIMYAGEEMTAPARVVTSTVAVEGALLPRLPVKSASPVPKSLVRDTVRALQSVRVVSPVRRGEVVARNVAGSGADFIATRDL